VNTKDNDHQINERTGEKTEHLHLFSQLFSPGDDEEVPVNPMLNQKEMGMSSKSFSDDFLENVRTLAAYFILRQHLVMVAMLELNPRWLDKNLIGINTKPYLDGYREKMQEEVRARSKNKLKEKVEVYKPPIWKGDWEYFAHGNGCRLTHLRTREPIEWDAPDPNEFNIGWFLNHLAWRLKNEPEDPYIKMCSNWLESQQADIEVIKKAVFRLIDNGVLKLRTGYTCVMVNKEEETRNDDTSLPHEVIKALITAIIEYRERQKLAIEAMIELRPDFVIEVAEDPYLLPKTAQRLKQLYQHLQSPPRGS